MWDISSLQEVFGQQYTDTLMLVRLCRCEETQVAEVTLELEQRCLATPPRLALLLVKTPTRVQQKKYLKYEPQKEDLPLPSTLHLLESE